MIVCEAFGMIYELGSRIYLSFMALFIRFAGQRNIAYSRYKVSGLKKQVLTIEIPGLISRWGSFTKIPHNLVVFSAGNSSLPKQITTNPHLFTQRARIILKFQIPHSNTCCCCCWGVIP